MEHNKLKKSNVRPRGEILEKIRILQMTTREFKRKTSESSTAVAGLGFVLLIVVALFFGSLINEYTSGTFFIPGLIIMILAVAGAIGAGILFIYRRDSLNLDRRLNVIEGLERFLFLVEQPDGLEKVHKVLDNIILTLEEIRNIAPRRLLNKYNAWIHAFSWAASADKPVYEPVADTGKDIQVVRKDKYLHAYELYKGLETVLVISGHRSAVRSVEFSPDGKCVLSASLDGTVCVWDALGGERLLRLNMDSPDEPVFDDIDDETDEALELLYRLQDDDAGSRDNAVFSARFDPSGERILTADRKGRAVVWDARSGLEVDILVGHSRLVKSAAWSPCGKYIVTGSADKTACLWLARPGIMLETVAKSNNMVADVDFSPYGEDVLIASGDGTARIFNLMTGLETGIFRHKHSLWSARFSPDGKTVATCSHDRTARLWNVETGEELRRFEGFSGWVNKVGFDCSGRYLLTASWKGLVCIYDVRTGERIHGFDAHPEWVMDACFSPDGRVIATSSKDGTVKIWANPADPRNSYISGKKGGK